MMLRYFKPLTLLLAIPLLSGCVVAATTAITETAIVAAQERSVGNAVDDAGILLAIKEKYLQHDINDLLANVLVKVNEGRVLLTGNVDTPQTQIDAVRLAWQVSGVREVINEIVINDRSSFWNYARDVWISTQIRSRLLFNSHIYSVNYSVITVNQVVYLFGVAQNQTELENVAKVAGTTKYVKKVISHVYLKTDERRGVWSQEPKPTYVQQETTIVPQQSTEYPSEIPSQRY